jgi:uncharacterized protein
MELQVLIDGLSRPGAYPVPVDVVEVHQTHLSVVFLAGPFAYKIKKPVCLAFVDLSTLAKREQDSINEVRLNRRLAAEVYLGVVAITQGAAGLCVEGNGVAVEWAVKMQRLPAEATLEQRLGRGEVDEDLLRLLAARLAVFHAQAETNAWIASFGRLEVVAGNVRDNLAAAAAQVGFTLSSEVLDRLRTLTEHHLQRLGPLIENRAARGVPRDTHGDLHLDHVYYFPERQKEPLVLIDCIAFNDRFRYADPVSDLAFLVMDLICHGRRDLASVLSEAYFAATGDAEGRALLPFYTAYRAAVRAKVDGLELVEQEVPAEERQQALERARAHWLLAAEALA